MSNRLYIREHIDKKEEEFISYNKTPFIDMFYDPDKEVLFFVLKLPVSWDKELDPLKIYEFEFIWETTEVCLFKVYQQIGRNTYVVAEHYDGHYYKQSYSSYFRENNVRIIPVEEYFKEKRGF